MTRSPSRCEAPSLESVTDEVGRAYRKFAEQTGSDLKALAACIRTARETLTRAQLATIDGADPGRGRLEGRRCRRRPSRLAGSFRAREFLEIPNRDHMLATGDRAYKQGVLDFLERRP